ncbi:MAG: ATP-dependent helicase, partial [Candidatus Marinimicrobia bacterium]|nr:ATP-dependent helicase [Candidatus Neomarinimicrobiota bacterium]
EYQLEPTIQALKQYRQRILIADAVGLGKTLEAGILVSELMRRGKGRRILCLTMKSMLTQFQKEFWTRFSIPLVRLDSVGIRRIRRKIPSNHNPFYFYDKTIISIDTLKQDTQYRTYLENCYWDIIIIDEAQNVAHRGDSKSLRARLAELLADRSDTMIMLSATPHDGKPESFASLMRMLEPTAIADEQNYSKEDIKGLFIRRYKKDIEHQVQQKFKERIIHKEVVESSNMEDSVFDQLAHLKFSSLDKGRGAGQLFRTTLEKALLSSPAACLETIQKRIKRTEEKDDPDLEDDLHTLHNFETALKQVSLDEFSKYQRLIDLLKDPIKFDWKREQPDDRLVIFTERIRTMHFLHDELKKELSLSDVEITTLHGSMSDMEQQAVVEQFGNKQSSLRVLVASDVASEGINLHYQCHRLIHFDIPWSLMIFQQRNGRIDRYGQTETPQIYYLVQQSGVEKIKADQRILELLIEKDEYAQKNIGDSSVFMGQYDADAEEKRTAEAIESESTPEEFENKFMQNTTDMLDQLMGHSEELKAESPELIDEYLTTMPSLFRDDFEYVESALRSLPERFARQISIEKDDNLITWTLPEPVRELYNKYYPDEIKPEDWQINLTDDKKKMQQEIERSREDEDSWPRADYLWELHPVVQWLTDKSLNAFGRQEAPVVEVQEGLEPGEQLIVCSGTFPNKLGQPILHKWAAAHFKNGSSEPEIHQFDEFVEMLGLSERAIPNQNNQIDTSELSERLPVALDSIRTWLEQQKNEMDDQMNKKLNKHLKELEDFRDRQISQLEVQYSDSKNLNKKQQKYDKLMGDYMEYIENKLVFESIPHIQVAAAFIRN